MSENKYVKLLLAPDSETDSADESFVFTRKRKADKFFIDLTDENSTCNKISRNEVELVPNMAQNVVQVNPEVNGRAQPEGNSEVQVAKFIPGDQLALKNEHDSVTLKTISQPSRHVQRSLPDLKSPPHVARVTTARKSSHVIDLTDRDTSKEEPAEDTDNTSQCPKVSKLQAINYEAGPVYVH